MQVAVHSIQLKNLSLLIITSYAMYIIENFYELILFYWDEAATICKILSLFLNESYWLVNNYSSEPILHSGLWGGFTRFFCYFTIVSLLNYFLWIFLVIIIFRVMFKYIFNGLKALKRSNIHKKILFWDEY